MTRGGESRSGDSNAVWLVYAAGKKGNVGGGVGDARKRGRKLTDREEIQAPSA